MQATWCRIEIEVDFTTQVPERIADGDGYNVRPIRDSDLDSGNYPSYCCSAPPLVVMSLNLKSVMNYKTNVNEIVIASALVYHKGS
jgi:DNA polymerase alpha subunit A